MPIADFTLDVWGGIECTVNRIQDRYQDQLVLNGHHHRSNDLIELAALGLRTLRYPILWERTAPNRLNELNWPWADERLKQLRELQIRPILGLVHHGCGPQYATFNTDAFTWMLPQYARQVAERYPWVDAYTPINEPLTTARFSGLYGHWYPHGQSDKLFAQILLRQCEATVRAMQLIRQIRSDAQLIQTEDLGQTHSTPLLQRQADWENQRRWLTWDILCGWVNPDHPFWDYFRRVGIEEKTLWFFVDNPCPPSILGINHYVTSERYLDEHLSVYPVHLHGGNGHFSYADTEVVRAAPELRIGLGGLLEQAWERYKIPLVVTEAHLGCSPDEQIRWLWDVWQQALAAKRAGIDIQAITAWALLGSYDWHCLLTRQEGYYESGAFDVRSGKLKLTPLAQFVYQLATGRQPQSRVPMGKGWWQLEVEKLMA